MYAELSIVVNGALESTEIYFDETLLNEAISYFKEDAESHGYPTQVYVSYHDHSPDIECECAQYETDHHPAYEYNVD